MYNWIESTFNVSGGVTQAIAVILALAVVLLLFSLFIFVLKRLMGSNAPQVRNRQPRVAIMDSTTVDARRRLVLVRRDNVEHLILIGGPSDVVVEQNIVRNAPVTAPRQGTHGAASHSAPGALKVPLAPGPDLPARPDETVSPPAPMKAPAAAAPVAAQTFEKRLAPQPAPPPGPDDAAAPRPLAGNGIKPVSDAGSVNGPLQSTATKAPDPLSGTNRTAADLLKAATQNGFNRSANASPRREEVVKPEPLDSAETGASAPEVKPVSPVGMEPDKEMTVKSGSPPGGLTRPHLSRERQSQGVGHSITPPASGPAARAKTAFLRPVEPIEPVQKEEPSFQAPPAAEEKIPSGETSASEKADEPEKTPVETVSTTDENEEAPVSEASGEADIEPVIALSDAPDASEDDAPVEPVAEASVEDPPEKPETEDEVQPEVRNDGKLNLELELGDLIDDSLQKPVADAAPTKEPEPVKPPSQSQSQAEGEQTPKSSATLDIVPNGRQTHQTAKPTASVSKGLGDKNPIEDEMAKLLDELGGQPHQ